MTSLARGGHGVGWLRGESLRLYRLYGFFVKLKLANTEYSLLSLARAAHVKRERVEPGARSVEALACRRTLQCQQSAGSGRGRRVGQRLVAV